MIRPKSGTSHASADQVQEDLHGSGSSEDSPATDLTDVDLDAIISQGSFDQSSTGSQGQHIQQLPTQLVQVATLNTSEGFVWTVDWYSDLDKTAASTTLPDAEAQVSAVDVGGALQAS